MMISHLEAPCSHDPADQSGVADSPLRQAARSLLSQSHRALPGRGVRLAKRRLEDIAAELNLLFAYRIEAESCFAQMCALGRPVLNLGKSIGLRLTVEIDPDSDHFLLVEESGPYPCILVTASEARLIDQIVSSVASIYDPLTPHTVDGAVDVLIGQSLADMECRLLLRTMQFFKGNAAQAAFALGVSEHELVMLMRKHLVDANTPLSSSKGRQ